MASTELVADAGHIWAIQCHRDILIVNMGVCVRSLDFDARALMLAKNRVLSISTSACVDCSTRMRPSAAKKLLSCHCLTECVRFKRDTSVESTSDAHMQYEYIETRLCSILSERGDIQCLFTSANWNASPGSRTRTVPNLISECEGCSRRNILTIH